LLVDGEAMPAWDARRRDGQHAPEGRLQRTNCEARIACPGVRVAMTLAPLLAYWAPKFGHVRASPPPVAASARSYSALPI
jgi:hypothetical protein